MDLRGKQTSLYKYPLTLRGPSGSAPYQYSTPPNFKNSRHNPSLVLPENFCSHNETGRLGIYLDVSRDKPHVAKRRPEVSKLLIGQCLDRRCVDCSVTKTGNYLSVRACREWSKGWSNQKADRRTNLVMCLRDSAIAYSATTVFPAEVCAATKTLSWVSKCNTACFWKTSNSNGHYEEENHPLNLRYTMHNNYNNMRDCRLGLQDFTATLSSVLIIKKAQWCTELPNFNVVQ